MPDFFIFFFLLFFPPDKTTVHPAAPSRQGVRRPIRSPVSGSKDKKNSGCSPFKMRRLKVRPSFGEGQLLGYKNVLLNQKRGPTTDVLLFTSLQCVEVAVPQRCKFFCSFFESLCSSVLSLRTRPESPLSFIHSRPHKVYLKKDSAQEVSNDKTHNLLKRQF